MKKILFLSLLLCFCMTSVAGAEIRKRVHSFDETVKIYSVQENVGKMKGQFNFIKSMSPAGETGFQIYASTEIGKHYNFAKDYVEIKIDGKIMIIKVVRNRDYKDTHNGVYDIATTVQLSGEIVNSLKSAQKVTLRFHRENGYEDIVEIPDDVLSEWKQVIDMEK